MIIIVFGVCKDYYSKETMKEHNLKYWWTIYMELDSEDLDPYIRIFL